MSNSILTVLHVFISNVFLMNYLVAILATVYEIMMDGGEFAYKSCKYQFIEKYSIAILDKNGYSELILHPPPINLFSLILWPFVIKASVMKKASDCFSKFIFWIENVAYIWCFLIYELFLCPYIYLKTLVIVAYLSTWLSLIPMFIFWIALGPFILMFALCKDFFFYIKILCDYQEEEDQFKEKEEEDFK